nr:heat shock protein 90-2 [Tanacetum cinerariifolium]
MFCMVSFISPSHIWTHLPYHFPSPSLPLLISSLLIPLKFEGLASCYASISNQSDVQRLCLALDKIRFKSLTEKNKLGGQSELFIHIVLDKTNSTVTITDSEVRMTKAGIIARSGTKEFMETIAVVLMSA